jgi:Fe-S cluster assembly protein SufD
MTQSAVANIDSKENYFNDFEIFSELFGKSFSQLRRNAMDEFLKIGFPTIKHEEWKYTNISPILKTSFNPANPALKATISKEEIEQYKVAGKDATVVVFINGRYYADLSDISSGVQNIKITSLASDTDFVKNYFGKLASFEKETFVALNTAFHFDGVLIHICENTVAKPIHILHISDSRVEGIASYPRNIVVVDKNSKAQIISTYHSLNNSNHSLTNVVTEIFVGENAYVEYDIKQDETDLACQINQTYVKQQRNSTFDISTVTVGGALVRNNLNILLSDIGCTAHLFGLAIAGGDQVIDNHTVVDHASPQCQSNELYKFILDGKSHGVFNGKIFVRKDAQKTNAYQSNKNILLSRDAIMNAKPQLEIFADDVKCSHGATTGQLDEEALFYLRSRGIGEQNAKALLNFAFASNVIEKINNESLKHNLLQILSKKLNSNITFDSE